MFGKKVIVPTTVAEAIAPLRQVQDNLKAVLATHTERKRVAAKRISDAKDYAAQVDRDETAASEAAQAELAQAERISIALSQLLGDPAQTAEVTEEA